MRYSVILVETLLVPPVSPVSLKTRDQRVWHCSPEHKRNEVHGLTPIFRTSKLLEITTLHNGMILSTLSISSRGFTFGFPKRPHTSGDVFLTYKLMIILLISKCGPPTLQSSTILSSNKVHHRASPKAYGPLE